MRPVAAAVGREGGGEQGSLVVLGRLRGAFAPTATMPSWLQPIADHNPVTALVDTLRGLFNGTEIGSSAWEALAWTFGVLVIFLVLSVRRFRRASLH